jgi:polyhydroxyalkanoate synthesis regulator phasin
MAQTDLLKKYLDAGLAFTQMTQQRAEAIVKDLVKAGEVQASQATQRRNELLERSRQNTENMFAAIRKEVGEQVKALGLATQSDVEALRKEISTLKRAGAPAKAAAPKKAPVKKAPGRPSGATATKKAAR